MNNRFSLTIHDDDGIITLDIVDHQTKRKTTISQEEMGDRTGLDSFSLCEIVIKDLKRKFRSVVNQEV